MKTYFLYNPMAANNNCINIIKDINLNDYELVDITKIKNYQNYFNSIENVDEIIIAGGDGTLNKFINDTKNISINNRLYYYPAGTGNDFYNDVHNIDNNKLINLNKYITKLPIVKVNDMQYKFLNGIGYGIDGYCCEVGDKLKSKSKKQINYAKIAIKGLLFYYKPTKATIEIDGKEYSYDNVWLAPTMNGKFYGGGMMPTPNQDRFSDNVSVMVYHCKSKLKALMVFPYIFKGEHIKNKKIVSIYSGKEIKITFDAPRALQIDGETIKNVLNYEVYK